MAPECTLRHSRFRTVSGGLADNLANITETSLSVSEVARACCPSPERQGLGVLTRYRLPYFRVGGRRSTSGRRPA